MLPSEITDAIIDYLHDDKASLAACGLICRTWLPSSRYHLFSNITLSINSIRSFAELLQNPFNNVALMVRRLTVAPHPAPYGASVDEKRRAQSAAIFEILPRITTYLHAIKSLGLHDLDLTSYACPPEILQFILSNLSGVEELELSSLKVCGLQDAIDIICAFPLLRSLSLNAFGWDTRDQLLHLSNPPYSSTSRYQQRPPFTVNSIDLASAPPREFIDWLLNPVPSIRTVRCIPCAYRGVEYPSLILSRAGASVQEIEVNFGTIFGLEPSSPLIDITTCTSLRSIHFHQMKSLLQCADEQKRLILLILAQVTSPSIEELSFEINTNATRWALEEAYFDWSDVADMLLYSQFRNLKRVRIKCPLSHVMHAESFFTEGPLSQITKCRPN